MPLCPKGRLRSGLGLFLIVSNNAAKVISTRMGVERALPKISAF